MTVSASPGDRPPAEHPADASRAAYDLLPLPVLVCERRGLAAGRVFANAAFERLTGVSQRDWRERGHECFLDAASARCLDAASGELQAGADAEVANLAGFTAAGRPLALRARLRAAADGQRIVIGLDDHSFQSLALRAAEWREARLRAIGDFSGDAVTIIDAEGRIAFSAGNIQGILGVAPGTRLGQLAIELVHPEDRAGVAAELAAVAASRGSVARREFRVIHADGSWRWIGAVARGMADDPAIGGVLLSLRDVSDRRRAEELLAASELRHRALLGDAHTVAVISDAAGVVTFVTANVERELGIKQCDMVGTLAFDWLHPDERAEAVARLQLHAVDPAMAMQTVRERRVRHRDGRWLWFEMQSGNRLDVPGIHGIVHYLRNVEARRQAEAQARVSDDRYRSVVEMLPGYVHESVLGADGYWHIVWVSQSFQTLFGADARTFEDRGGWLGHIHPDDIAAVTVRQQRLCRGESTVGDFRVQVPAGLRWIHARNRVLRDPDGAITGVIGIGLDVTELHRVSRLLEETQELARSGAFDVDLLTGEVRWTQATYRLAGLSEGGEAPSLAKIQSLFPPDDWLHVQRAVVVAARSGAPFDFEARVRGQDGRVTWVRAVGQAELSGGRASRVFGAFQDIDNLKRAQLELANQAEQLRLQAQILATMTEGVAVGDADGRLLFTNPAFDRMFAAPRGSLLDSVVVDLCEPLDAARRQLMSEASGADAAAQSHEFTGVRRDGTRFAAASVSTSIMLAGVRHWLSVVQDVSERKLLERELIAIASREQERIGHDLHDGLGQELTGIALLLRSLAGRVRKELPGSAPELDDIVQLVNQAINNTRLLAGGLSPLVVERGGLGGALHALADRARELYSLDVTLQIRGEAGAELGRSAAVQLYRIAQEAVTNAARHAAASRVRIALRADGDRLLLTVKDDGRGMPADATGGGGLGLKIMNYRAGMIGGRLQLESAPGKGTLVRISCARSPTE